MDVNFVHEKYFTDRQFIDSIFGPFDPREEFVNIDDTWSWEDIWVYVGLFSSKNQARKNGHGGKIEDGFHDTIIKKKRNIKVTVLNKFDE